MTSDRKAAIAAYKERNIALLAARAARAVHERDRRRARINGAGRVSRAALAGRRRVCEDDVSRPTASLLEM